jgi:hypothetical protein
MVEILLEEMKCRVVDSNGTGYPGMGGRITELECRRVSRFIADQKWSKEPLFFRVFNRLYTSAELKSVEMNLAIFVPLQTFQL